MIVISFEHVFIVDIIMYFGGIYSDIVSRLCIEIAVVVHHETVVIFIDFHNGPQVIFIAICITLYCVLCIFMRAVAILQVGGIERAFFIGAFTFYLIDRSGSSGRSILIEDKCAGIFVAREDVCTVFGCIYISFFGAERTMYIDGGIGRACLFVAFGGTSVPTRRVPNNFGIGSAVFLSIYVAESVFVPIVSIIYIQCTGMLRVIFILSYGNGGFFIHFHFCAREQTGILLEVHSTGKQVNLHVGCNRQVEISRVQANRNSAKVAYRYIQFTHIQYHRANVGTTIDVVDLNIIFCVIPFAYPGVVSIGIVIHQEDGGIPSANSNHFDVIGSHRDCERPHQAFRYCGSGRKYCAWMVFNG